MARSRKTPKRNGSRNGSKRLAGGNAARRTNEPYRTRLRDTIQQLLPRELLKTLTSDRRLRWTSMLLVLAAIMMAWSTAPTLAERFQTARSRLLRWYPGRRRPGSSYHGFIDGLRQRGNPLAKAISRHYRGHVRRIAEERGCWWVGPYVPMTVDGSKIDLPRTKANEDKIGTCGKAGTWPQMLLTVTQHLGTGLPWAFLRGRAKSSERRHLLGMLHTLPKDAILVADAGFTGFELWRKILASDRAMLIRVGSNVKLLKKLNLSAEDGSDDDTVWVWPQDQQKKRAKPLMLRWIRVTDGRGRTMHLLTNVMDRSDKGLSDATAKTLYTMRWGVELLYRSLKQTMQKRKMLSDSPGNARTELTWAFLGLWTLLLIKAERTGESLRTAHAAQGVADVRRVLQLAMVDETWNLDTALKRLEADSYTRKTSKRSREWPHKKTESPPGEPVVRNATEEETALAKELIEANIAA